MKPSSLTTHEATNLHHPPAFFDPPAFGLQETVLCQRLNAWSEELMSAADLKRSAWSRSFPAHVPWRKRFGLVGAGWMVGWLDGGDDGWMVGWDDGWMVVGVG